MQLGLGLRTIHHRDAVRVWVGVYIRKFAVRIRIKVEYITDDAVKACMKKVIPNQPFGTLN